MTKLNELSHADRRKVSGKKCPKCGGYMIYDKFYDETGDFFWGWKCINCGKIIDQVILHNQPIGNQIDSLFDDFTKGGDND